jgi:serine/threonine protein kinase
MVGEGAHAVSGAEASAPAWSPPSRAGRRYTILRRLAIGGMGELLLARAAGPQGMAKLVAIKRVRPEYASDPTFVSMFLNEARLAATLDHPNVVRTYDLVEDAGGFFMVMEYLHGEPLGRLLNAANRSGQPVPLQHVLTIALGVAAGLHCAHERAGVDGRPLGIVHRDLSPGNVFITYEGGVKLLDFGIAKATSRTSITLGPTRKGKVSYMSPEQCVGGDIDRRSDIFSLGIVMWELCTGQRLFRGDNEFGIMNQITTLDAPSPRQHVPQLPEALCDILARALQRDREARYQTAMELHDALEGFAGQAGLMPSSAALARYLEASCGHRDYPSVEPSVEFIHSEGATLVVPASEPEPSRAPRKLSLILALAAGAIGGAVAVGASSSKSAAESRDSAVGVSSPAAMEAQRAEAPPRPTEAEPGPVEVDAPPVAGDRPEAVVPASDPDAAPPAPEAAALPRDDKPRRNRPRTRPSPSRAKKTPPTEDKAVRGVDGLLPRG